MSERFAITNKNTISMIDKLLDNYKYIDYTGRKKPKEVKDAVDKMKKLKKKLESYEIDLSDDWSD